MLPLVQFEENVGFAKNGDLAASWQKVEHIL